MIRTPFLRTDQALTLPQDQSFELGALFKFLGRKNPSNAQYTYMRQWLESNGYILDKHVGRQEWWTKKGNRSLNEQLDKNIYSIKSWVIKFFPGCSPNFDLAQSLQYQKIMLSRGYRPRMGGEYWSMKASRRKYAKSPLPKPTVPNYVRIPPGSFALLDLLELNKMRRYPENFVWARKYLEEKGIKRIHGTHRYAAKDARGKLPAVVTGNWEVPGDVFTTYEFQKLNNARRCTSTQWASAVEFLQHNGYIYDPKWKRWKK